MCKLKIDLKREKEKPKRKDMKINHNQNNSSSVIEWLGKKKSSFSTLNQETIGSNSVKNSTSTIHPCRFALPVLCTVVNPLDTSSILCLGLFI